MGVRLYPKLKEGVTLNQLIGVSDADYQRYLDLNAKYDSGAMDGDTYYGLLYSKGFEGVNEVNGFDLFGWGKFEPIACMRGDDGYVSYCGELDDMEKVADLIWLNSIQVDLDLIRGVYWV